jgi:hypothetical protein
MVCRILKIDLVTLSIGIKVTAGHHEVDLKHRGRADIHGVGSQES